MLELITIVVVYFSLGWFVRKLFAKKSQPKSSDGKTAYNVQIIKAVREGQDYTILYEEVILACDGVAARDVVAEKFQKLFPRADISHLYASVLPVQGNSSTRKSSTE